MSPELELQVVVSHPVWALGSELSFLVKSVYVLHCWIVSRPRDFILFRIAWSFSAILVCLVYTSFKGILDIEGYFYGYIINLLGVYSVR